MSDENIARTIEIPKDVARLIKDDEPILWAGEPEGTLFNKNDRILIPFTVTWFAVFIYWLVSMIQKGSIDVAFAIFWGGIFIVAGIYMLILRFFIKRNNAKNTKYILTSKKAIIYYLNKKDIKKFSRKEMLNFQIKKEKGNIGSIIFLIEKGGYLITANTGLEGISMGNVYGFFDIKDVDYVNSLIDSLR